MDSAHSPRILAWTAVTLTLLSGVSSLAAAEVQIAAAANLSPALTRLAPLFEAASGHRLLASYGSTGKLYAQIVNGAPFDVFLAADAERPRLLEESGAAVAGSRFTYARGRLALWSPQAALVDTAGAVLATGMFAHLALANPRTAPYGEAARQTLAALNLWDALQPRLVFGEDIGQAHQFVASGAAELGFVALSQVRAAAAAGPQAPAGSLWIVPQRLYAPLDQQAVLLVRARDNAAAAAFLAYLRGAQARAVFEELGYALAAPDSSAAGGTAAPAAPAAPGSPVEPAREAAPAPPPPPIKAP